MTEFIGRRTVSTPVLSPPPPQLYHPQAHAFVRASANPYKSAAAAVQFPAGGGRPSSPSSSPASALFPAVAAPGAAAAGAAGGGGRHVPYLKRLHVDDADPGSAGNTSCKRSFQKL